MKPEHVEEFLARYESKPNGQGITVNLRGVLKPLEGEPPENVRAFQAHQIVALSATYAPAVPFPKEARVTKADVYFPSKESALGYFEALIAAGWKWTFPKGGQGPAGNIRKIGKSWRICRWAPGKGWKPYRL